MYDVVFAAERLFPATGGAERFASELLASLSRSASVRPVWVRDGRPPAEPYWRAKRLACEAVERLVAEELVARRADVVVTQLHAAPGAVAAAAEAGVPAVVLLPSYEPLCKYAFDAGSDCYDPPCRCACAAALALSDDERDELRRARERQTEALALAAELVAPSAHVAATYDAWIGRRPAVVAPVAGPTSPSRPPDPNGHVLLAAAWWSANKGERLLVPLVEALPERQLVIAGDGLDDAHRAQLAARPNVTLSSPRPAAELLAGAALALVPSQWPEPFGRAAFEAMSAGVPCLASARGGLTELVPATELVVAASAPAAWADAVRGLTDERRWRAAQERARLRSSMLLATRPLEELERLLARAAARATVR